MTTISTRFIVRDDMGRFKADCLAAATAVVRDCLDAGVAAARVAAPERTGLLRGSFVDEILSRTSGHFLNTADYALYQDQGAGPHPLPGNVTFWWENEGRFWEPGDNTISHPGNPATHFMDAGYDAMKRVAGPSMQAHYPG